MPAYVDVLDLLRDASGALGHNELIQSQHVTLFEATSAVEIGEPRMDAGAIQDEPTDGGFDPNRALLPEEIVWIMDSLLCCEVRLSSLSGCAYAEPFRSIRIKGTERQKRILGCVALPQMTWMQGYSLAQTLWTCRYMHDTEPLGWSDSTEAIIRSAGQRRLPAEYPHQLVSTVLRAYFRATLKTADIVMEELLKGRVYDVSSEMLPSRTETGFVLQASWCALRLHDRLQADEACRSRTRTSRATKQAYLCSRMSRSTRSSARSTRLRTGSLHGQEVRAHVDRPGLTNVFGSASTDRS